MRIEQNGLEAAIFGLQRLRGRLLNPAPLMQQIGMMLSNSTTERIHTKKSPDGSVWQPLAHATIKRKGHDNILVDKGDLLDSITFSASSWTARIFSTDQNQGKVRGHQFGSDRLPARAIFGLSQGDREDIENLAVIWMEEAL